MPPLEIPQDHQKRWDICWFWRRSSSWFDNLLRTITYPIPNLKPLSSDEFPNFPKLGYGSVPRKKNQIKHSQKISSHALFKGEHQQSQVHHSNLSESKGVGVIIPKKMAHFARGIKKNGPLSRGVLAGHCGASTNRKTAPIEQVTQD